MCVHDDTLDGWYVGDVDRQEARRLASALRDQLWSTASDALLQSLADRGGLNVGLNPPDQIEDEELVELVWRALEAAELADAP
jgi:hypothetical protein